MLVESQLMTTACKISISPLLTTSFMIRHFRETLLTKLQKLVIIYISADLLM